MAVSAIGIARNAPNGPILKVFANRYASGIWNNQNPTKLSIVGVFVSPAPFNDWIITDH